MCVCVCVCVREREREVVLFYSPIESPFRDWSKTAMRAMFIRFIQMISLNIKMFREFLCVLCSSFGRLTGKGVLLLIVVEDECLRKETKLRAGTSGGGWD